MFIDKDSLIINGVNMGQYITQAEYQYHKLWDGKTGRNLASEMTGTLIGIFPKIIVTFKPLTKSQLEVIAPILDSVRQTVSYYDPTKKRQISIETYTGDWSVVDRHIITERMRNDGFNISFISIKRRA